MHTYCVISLLENKSTRGIITDKFYFFSWQNCLKGLKLVQYTKPMNKSSKPYGNSKRAVDGGMQQWKKGPMDLWGRPEFAVGVDGNSNRYDESVWWYVQKGGLQLYLFLFGAGLFFLERSVIYVLFGISMATLQFNLTSEIIYI